MEKSKIIKWAFIAAIILIALIAVYKVFGEQKTLIWTPGPVDPEHPAADGYKVYMGNAPGIDPADPETYIAVQDVGDVLSYDHTACGVVRYFVVTAYKDYDGVIVESPPSNEIFHDFAVCAPSAPTLEFQPPPSPASPAPEGGPDPTG